MQTQTKYESPTSHPQIICHHAAHPSKTGEIKEVLIGHRIPNSPGANLTF